MEFKSGELETLVYSAYAWGLISEGRGMQLLSLNRLDYRAGFAVWLTRNPSVKF